MNYAHRWLGKGGPDLPVGKVVCVGRNYASHARELGNAVPEQPILFLKSANSLVSAEPQFAIPVDRGECHFETEIAVLLGHPLTRASADQAAAAVCGLGIGLDLTLRDLQNQLKQAGQPWERAKSFDGACPLSGFAVCDGLPDQTLQLQMHINGELRQQGSSVEMLFAIPELVAEMSHAFSLMPGDVVLTGTPAGVGPLQAGDRIQAELSGWSSLSAAVVESPF